MGKKLLIFFVIFLLSLFGAMSALGNLTMGEFQKIFQSSFIITDSTRNHWVGLYNTGEEIIKVVVTRNNGNYSVNHMRGNASDFKNEIQTLLDSKLWVVTTWEALSAPVKMAVFNYGYNFISLPVYVPMILFVTPTGVYDETSDCGN